MKPRHWLLLLALCLPFSVAPQNRPSPASEQQQPYVFRSDVSLVTLTATVSDSVGRYARGLRREDFAVYEDGSRQQIALFRDEIEPVSLGIVFDTSGSMRNKIEDVADAVAHFAATAQPEDDIFLMRFASNVELVVDFTSDRGLLARAAQGLRAGGTTVLYDAVAEALDKVQQGRHRKRALVVITDGMDKSSRTRFDDLLEMARQAEVLIYCLGIGPSETRGYSQPTWQIPNRWPWPGRWPASRRRVPQNEEGVDMNVLNALAEAGGARAYQIEQSHAGGRDRLDDAVQEISSELRQQYLIGYYPTNLSRDGTYRRIQVAVNRPGLSVRTRRGYYAPRG